MQTTICGSPQMVIRRKVGVNPLWKQNDNIYLNSNQIDADNERRTAQEIMISGVNCSAI